MEKDSHSVINSLRVDGGMSISDFVMEMQANVLNIPVRRPDMLETTSWGYVDIFHYLIWTFLIINRKLKFSAVITFTLIGPINVRAAIAAGLSTGFWTSVDDLKRSLTPSIHEFKPSTESQAYDEYFAQYGR